MSAVPGPADDSSPAFWRSFLIYSGSRVAVFAVLLGLLYGVGVRGLIVIFVALVLSGILSYFLLDRQRTAFATALEARVERRRAKAVARASREDAAADELIAAQTSPHGVGSGDNRGA